MSIKRPVLTGLRGFAGSPWVDSTKSFDPVSRDEADSSDKDLSDARLHITGTPTGGAQPLESAKTG